ncbi:RNA-binding protein rnc1 [Cyphellophora attinorum]|uniref:RNA-binding protein rnc1 n=1 Tax=Cyphellophora attinorum TaxID=1664694 RepID=A0A0N1P109_9EURO|nr:RNA-binding protein rnc1 [Phialophora attinorum]KPI39930.1 RNA-binding protein rnc1 [Phialophora attinorum]
MSASPSSAAAVPSTKRPLEDPSSPSAPSDYPDAKRPALDKPDAATAVAEESAVTATTNGTAVDHTDGGEPQSAVKAEEPQPIPSTSSDTTATASPIANQDETKWIHIRAVISSAEAATCIGKGGENVTQIRKMSGAKCTVSDYSRGAVERILTVSGAQDAVAKAFGLIIRTLNQESLDQPSTSQSKTYPLRLLVPHILIGSIIGKSGVRIREIQEASGARLNASDSCLPLSTERSLVVLGVADSVHIATYYIAVTLVEQLTERFGGPAASAYASRGGGPAGVVPGGMQVVPYVPQPAGGQYGHPDTYKRHGTQPPQRGPVAPYGGPQMGAQPHQPYQQHGGAQYPNTPRQASFGGQATPQQGGYAPNAMPGQPITQQIYIPNDMVGAIIGKGGAKINEIRHLSGSVIKINEPQDNSNERLVTITGTAECNQMALYMLYSRLENEKHRV